MAVFRLTNAGGGRLEITDIKKCCGAVVKLEKNHLSPGENAVLTVEYRAIRWAGPMTKKVGLVTNDSRNPMVELTITGEVVPTLAWTPSQIKILAYNEAARCPGITIKSLDSTPFSIKGFAATGQVMSVGFDPNTRATEFILKPVLDMTKVKALTTLSGSVAINVDHPDYKVINLGFDVIQPLQAIPSQILAFNAKMGEPVTKVVQLQDNQADPNTIAPVEIESVTARNGSRVELRGVAANKTGCELRLEIWPVGGKENETFSTDQLVVKLRDGRELTVPLRVFYPSPAVSSTAGPTSNP